MGLSGTRGLIRISLNPKCELQAAMVSDGVRETEFYQEITGEKFPGEYGERSAAKRRGVMFEHNLHKDDAALLRKVLAPLFRLDPLKMQVLNLTEEIADDDPAKWSKRFDLTQTIFHDLAGGKAVPDLLIQPQLKIVTGPAKADFDYVAPDFMVFDPAMEIFVPGEEKSFILRDGIGESIDLNLTRRQAAIQIIALRNQIAKFNIAERVMNRVILIFASPFGLQPAPPIQEKDLDAEVFEITRALQIIAEIKKKLTKRRDHTDHKDHKTLPLHLIANELTTELRNVCLGMCVMVHYCRTQAGETARTLGDEVSDLLGADLDLIRVSELLAGAMPINNHEAMLVEHLLDTAQAIKLINNRDWNFK